MTHRPKALVIGDDSRSFLATVRSLGRKGIEVHAAPYSMVAPALRSRYVHAVHRLPYYLNDGKDWLQAIRALMLKERFQIVIPCEERSLLPLYKHQQELPPECVLAIPEEKALDAFFDKLNTRALAAQCAVPIAKGHVLAPQDSTASVLSHLQLPVIAKCRKSYSWPDLYVRTSVKVLRTPEALGSWIKAHATEAGNLFLEETLPGFGLGVSVLCHAGKVLQAFEHHRAHEQMGSSYYRKSMPVHAERLQAVQRMVAAIGYTGIAMFEFKHDPDSGKWGLLEVNARPWGSLPLPVALGVDFPYGLYQVLVMKVEPAPAPYRSPVYGRNVVSDLWQARAVAQKLWPSKLATLTYLLKWFAGFSRILVGREHYDACTWDDPKPAFAEFKQLLTDRLYARRPADRAATLVTPARAVHALHALSDPKETKHIVFVCQGNICRSPYAEHKARTLLEKDHPNLRISSAGLLPRNRRPSPEHALEAAATNGVELQGHLSQYLTESVLNDADLLVIFDEINLSYFLDRYPESNKPLAFLGGLHPEAPIRIVKDPEGQSVESFVEIYRQIDQYLLDLKNLLSRPHV